MILGQFFKWFILVPACGLASVLALANSAHMDGFLGWPLQIVVVTASVQIGYFLGLVARSFFRAPKRSKGLSVRSLDETPSSLAETLESGKRAV